MAANCLARFHAPSAKRASSTVRTNLDYICNTTSPFEILDRTDYLLTTVLVFQTLTAPSYLCPQYGRRSDSYPLLQSKIPGLHGIA